MNAAIISDKYSKIYETFSLTIPDNFSFPYNQNLNRFFLLSNDILLLSPSVGHMRYGFIFYDPKRIARLDYNGIVANETIFMWFGNYDAHVLSFYSNSIAKVQYIMPVNLRRNNIKINLSTTNIVSNCTNNYSAHLSNITLIYTWGWEPTFKGGVTSIDIEMHPNHIINYFVGGYCSVGNLSSNNNVKFIYW